MRFRSLEQSNVNLSESLKIHILYSVKYPNEYFLIFSSGYHNHYKISAKFILFLKPYLALYFDLDTYLDLDLNLDIDLKIGIDIAYDLEYDIDKNLNLNLEIMLLNQIKLSKNHN